MVILVMGVTGSGKTTVGKLLARRLTWDFLDADDFHSKTNKEKMYQAIPLTDADRAPWLASIHDELLRRNDAGHNVVLACSALKQGYRDTLSAGLILTIVFLRGTPAQLHQHLSHPRAGHFADETLVPSQLATLEEPTNALIEDISQTPDQIVSDICTRLKS